jgi:hypothetical protein
MANNEMAETEQAPRAFSGGEETESHDPQQAGVNPDWIEARTSAELEALITQSMAELARRKQAVQPVRIHQSIGSYNHRRYSRPWIARVTAWPVGGRPELEWGRYLGDEAGGELEIMAHEGDIIRSGQKDTRGHNGGNDWYIVDASVGGLRHVTEPEARKAYRGQS